MSTITPITYMLLLIMVIVLLYCANTNLTCDKIPTKHKNTSNFLLTFLNNFQNLLKSIYLNHHRSNFISETCSLRLLMIRNKIYADVSKSSLRLGDTAVQRAKKWPKTSFSLLSPPSDVQFLF